MCDQLLVPDRKFLLGRNLEPEDQTPSRGGSTITAPPVKEVNRPPVGSISMHGGAGRLQLVA